MTVSTSSPSGKRREEVEVEALLRRVRLCMELEERVLGILRPPSEREDGAGERIGNIVLEYDGGERQTGSNMNPCGLSYLATRYKSYDPRFTIE
jgi:hypothetical protein